jgi:hypothetical protein
MVAFAISIPVLTVFCAFPALFPYLYMGRLDYFVPHIHLKDIADSLFLMLLCGICKICTLSTSIYRGEGGGLSEAGRREEREGRPAGTKKNQKKKPISFLLLFGSIYVGENLKSCFQHIRAMLN